MKIGYLLLTNMFISNKVMLNVVLLLITEDP